jgi:hypothetical protein
MSSGKIGGERTPATCINFLRPTRGEVRPISIAPRCTSTRSSPREGTMSATGAEREQRSEFLIFKSNSGSARVFNSAWQSLNTIPTLQR